ncbi:MAG TPA: Cof-type HAD-IIB family hydrolase [Symbiobacteriaceae bacterium]|jgi:hypothetical protein
MIKLVGVDVDGTLVGRNLEISPRTQAAVKAARARGVRFAIVTGRMFQSAVPYARTLGLEDMPLVAYNGAMVTEYPSGREIFHKGVEPEMGRKVAAFCEERGYYVQAYVGDKLYVERMHPLTEAYIATARVEAHAVGPLSRWLNAPATKMLIIHEPAVIRTIEAEVRARFGNAVDAMTSVPEFLEVISRGVSKGEGLQRVAEALGVRQEEVMAIGDGMNDLSMISWAGTSFAVAHAPQELKRAATYVTEAGPESAVAEALARVGLA